MTTQAHTTEGTRIMTTYVVQYRAPEAHSEWVTYSEHSTMLEAEYGQNSIRRIASCRFAWRILTTEGTAR